MASQCFLAGVSELGVSMGYASFAHYCVWPTDSGWIGGLTCMHWFFIDGSCFSHPYDCATFYISEGKRATSIDNHGCSVAIRDLACQQTGTCSLLVVNFSPAKAVWAAGSEQHAEHQFEQRYVYYHLSWLFVWCSSNDYWIKLVGIG